MFNSFSCAPPLVYLCVFPLLGAIRTTCRQKILGTGGEPAEATNVPAELPKDFKERWRSNKNELWWEHHWGGFRWCLAAGEAEYRSIFGFEPKEKIVLKNQEVVSDPEGMWAVLIHPAKDKKKAFDYDTEMCYRILELLSYIPNIRIKIEVGTLEEAMSVFYEPTEIDDGKVSQLILKGHGSPSSLTLSDQPLGQLKKDAGTVEERQTDEEKEATSNFFQAVRLKLAPTFIFEERTFEGRMVLDSCETAKPQEAGNLAEYVAKELPGHRVYASKTIIEPENLVFRGYPDFAWLIRRGNTGFGEGLWDPYKRRNVAWVGNCEPTVKHWKTQGGRDCATVAAFGGCLPSWRKGRENHTLEFDSNNTDSEIWQYAQKSDDTDNRFAHQVCCECGGGKTIGKTTPAPPV